MSGFVVFSVVVVVVETKECCWFVVGCYQHLERAVDLRSEDPVINDHLGDAYWRVGRKLEARFQWSHAKAYGPEPEDLKRIEEKLENGLPDDDSQIPAASANDPDKT